MSACCSRRVRFDSVTWRCLRSLLLLGYNLEVQRYNISTTGRRRRQLLNVCTWHRRLWANLSYIYRFSRPPLYLAIIVTVSRRRRQSKASKKSAESVKFSPAAEYMPKKIRRPLLAASYSTGCQSLIRTRSNHDQCQWHQLAYL